MRKLQNYQPAALPRIHHPCAAFFFENAFYREFTKTLAVKEPKRYIFKDWETL